MIVTITTQEAMEAVQAVELIQEVTDDLLHEIFDSECSILLWESDSLND